MQVHDAKPNDLGKLKFSAHVLLPKTDKVTQLAMKAAIDAAVAKGVEKGMWKLGANGELPEDFKKPIRDGDKELASGKKKDKNADLYEGNLFFNCSSDYKPAMVDKQQNKIPEDQQRTEVYSGAFYRFEINFYPYKTKGAIGVAAGLNAMQKVADGKRVGGGGSDGGNFGEYNDPDDSEEIAF